MKHLGISPSNRSLERGVEILRAFRPGSELLSNSELAERTGLSPATVSRLTQTLVRCGFLEHDQRLRAYRLAAPVLSLAHAMHTGSSILRIAAPIMRREAERRRVNIGLAVADRDDMIYLESVRYKRVGSPRNIVPGQRIPMELTSLGRAYLAVAPEGRREELFRAFRARRGRDWHGIEAEIIQSVQDVHSHGYCIASWQPEVVAIATPILVPNHPILVLNYSTATQKSCSEVAAELGPALLDLAKIMTEGFMKLEPN